MDVVWSIVLIIFTIIEHVISTPETEGLEVPLSKTLGLSELKNLEKTIKNEINQEYTMMYNELMKRNQEVFENMAEENPELGTDLIKLKNAEDRRRSVRMKSAIGRRRSRSQALRRQKLNSQSLRSHLQHSKQATSSAEREIKE